MSLFDLHVTKWGARFGGRRFPVAIGRGGIGRKQGEGDGITPLGTYYVREWLVRSDRLQAPFRPIHPRAIWCDDPSHPRYNEEGRAPFKASHEKLFRADPLYNLIGVIDYNIDPCIKGAGSAIFLHIWRRPRFPTAGCIAFAPDDLLWIAQNWQEDSKVVITS